MVKLLMSDERLDPSLNNNEQVRIAIKNGDSEIAELLQTDRRCRI